MRSCKSSTGLRLVAAIVLLTAFTATSLSRAELEVEGRDAMDDAEKTIMHLPVTIQVHNESEDVYYAMKIEEANSTKPVSEMQIEVNGKQIQVPELHSAASASVEQDQVGRTMGSFAETLQSVTDEDSCDCDPKDSADSVRKIIDATSRLSQDLLRCLLETLSSTIKRKEATLIRSIVRESMEALSKSVDGIYTIWRMDIEERNLKSVQTVVDGLMSVLTKFSIHLVDSISASEERRIETVRLVLNELVTLVANTSLAIGSDIDSGLSGPQLELALQLSEDLAEPLTSKVLAQFVNGTARIPAINKMLLRYYLESQKALNSCENSGKLRAALPKAILKALGNSLKSMTIKVATKDQGAAASEAHRVATTNFLYALIQDIESLLKSTSGIKHVSVACQSRVGESLSNVAAIVKEIFRTVVPELEEPREQQQAALVGNLIEDTADIISSIGGHLVEPENELQISNVTTLIYQQFEVIRRVAKNDQAIGRDSEEDRKSTLGLLVDVSRLEIRFLLLAVQRIRSSPNSAMRSTVLKQVSTMLIKSLVTVSRQAAPAKNEPLANLITSSGNALTEIVVVLEEVFGGKPRTYGDVTYEVFMALIEVDRKLISSVASPPRSGLATSVPSDVIFGTANAVRTAVDWSNALTRTSGLEPTIQAKLIQYVIEIVTSVETSLGENEQSNQGLDKSAISEMADIKEQLGKILSDTQKGVTTTTEAAYEYDYYNDYTEITPQSGISELMTLINKLHEIFETIVASNLRDNTSVVARNAGGIVDVIAVLLEDVSRTPQVREDGSVLLPSGILRPCTEGANQDESNGGNTVGSTPLPSSPVTDPPQTTTRASTTEADTTPRGRDGDDEDADGDTGKPYPGKVNPGGPEMPTTKEPDYTIDPIYTSPPFRPTDGDESQAPADDGVRAPGRICPLFYIHGHLAPCSNPGPYTMSTTARPGSSPATRPTPAVDPTRRPPVTSKTTKGQSLPDIRPTPSPIMPIAVGEPYPTTDGEPIVTIEPWLMSSSPPFVPELPEGQPDLSGKRVRMIDDTVVQSIKDQTNLDQEDLAMLEKLLIELLAKSSVNSCKKFDGEVPQWAQTENLVDVLNSLISRSHQVCMKDYI